MAVRIGSRTIQLNHVPSIVGFAAVGAKKEKEGPLADYFDYLSEDSSFGEKTWEKAETLMQKKAIELALQKGGIQKEQIDFLFAGDLLNQCISSAYASRELQLPFFGLYGACSTMAESLCLAGMFVDTKLASRCLAVTSSHFCSAERQFRFPLEYGGQRTPTAQWTVTGSGACIVAGKDRPPYLRAATVGTVADLGITDINNMGAAMAPAAAQTGCGCAASVLCSFILPQIACQRLKNVLFMATGALMSPTSVQQGESIPGIAHLLHLSAFAGKEEEVR